MSKNPLLTSSIPLAPKDAVAAIIQDERGRYLLQHRDAKADIIYPDSWCFFGGAAEPGEEAVETVVRELGEEISLELDGSRFGHFTRFTFDMAFTGGPVVSRDFFEAVLTPAEIATLVLHEGQSMSWVDGHECLTTLHMAPYDEFALWLHVMQRRLTFET